MTSTLPFDVVLISVLVFVAVLVLARIHALFESYAEGHMALAYYLATSGQAEKAVEEAQKALRFNPVHAHQIY